jgi:hypothetical protein
MRFIKGHHRRLASAAYVIRDCGYSTPCWDWQLTVSRTGYARMTHPTRRSSVEAHIVFYERRHGPVQEGLQLDHLCRNRACVNPDHLEPVTNAENARRGAATKLDWATVEEIRRLASSMSLRALGRRFGVGHSQIHRVVRGECWAEDTP